MRCHGRRTPLFSKSLIYWANIIFFSYSLKFTVCHICANFFLFWHSWRGLVGVWGVNGKFYNWNVLHPTVRIMSTTIKTERVNRKREQITIVNFHFIRDHVVSFLKTVLHRKIKRKGQKISRVVNEVPSHLEKSLQDVQTSLPILRNFFSSWWKLNCFFFLLPNAIKAANKFGGKNRKRKFELSYSFTQWTRVKVSLWMKKYFSQHVSPKKWKTCLLLVLKMNFYQFIIVLKKICGKYQFPKEAILFYVLCFAPIYSLQIYVRCCRKLLST